MDCICGRCGEWFDEIDALVDHFCEAKPYLEPGYFRRILIAADGMIQALLRRGAIGVTISSRTWTANVHQHRWGVWLNWALDRCWPFGRDPVTGESHCYGALKNDRLRALKALRELRGY